MSKDEKRAAEEARAARIAKRLEGFEETKKRGAGRRQHVDVSQDYAVDKAAFIVIWNTSNSLDEAMAGLEEYAKARGIRPMKRSIAAARASKYRRKEGLAMKDFSRSRSVEMTKEEAEQLIADVASGKVKREDVIKPKKQ